MFKPGRLARHDTDPSSPATGTPRLPGAMEGLFKSLLPATMGSALVVLLMGAALYVQLVQVVGDEISREHLQIEARQAQQAVVHQIDVLARTLDVLTQDPRLAAPLVAGETATLAALAENYRQALNAASVRIVLSGQAHKDDTSIPPISFAQLEMIKIAETGIAPPPEIHRFNQQTFVSLAAPLQREGTTLATLYAAFDFAGIRPRFPALPASVGYLEWQQVFPGVPPLLIANQGNPEYKTSDPVTLRWGVPHWSMNAYSSRQDPLMGRVTLALAVITGIAAMLVVTLGGLAFVLTRRRLRHNAIALAGFTQAQQNRNAGADPLDISLQGDDRHWLKGETSRTTPLQAPHPDDVDALGLDDFEVEAPALTRPTPGLTADIFRAYDIRGIVGSQLTPENARLIGNAIGAEARERGQRAIVVARDGRLSSESLQQALVEGLVAAGQQVIDIGMVPTPVLYFATHTLETQSGVMVTGSHNPPEYNGFKIVIAGITLANERIQALHARITRGNLVSSPGDYERRDILKEYRDRITRDITLARPMRIVIDCGNGVGGVVMPEIMDAVGCSVTTLFGEVDGRFPHHHPDPSIPDNLQALIAAVRHKNADLGIALDGDADRLGIVTPQGHILWPDRLLMLFARDLLGRHPGASVVYDVKCSRDVADLVNRQGGRAILCATGHSLMKAKMRDTGALLGGELSGHVFFKDRWYGFDDGIYAAARLLEILSMEPASIDDVFNDFPMRANTPEIKIACDESRKFGVVEKLAREGHFDGGDLVDIDGVRVDYPDGWGLLRASNTTPHLIARFEGNDDAALQRVIQCFREQLQRVEPGLGLPF